MSENDSTAENAPLDAEDWEIALQPYAGHPLDALTLAFHLTELKRQISGLQMHEALAAIDRAIDRLFEHSEFRSVGREMFLSAIRGELTTDQENLLHPLGIRI